jgi:hypothetical protein
VTDDKKNQLAKASRRPSRRERLRPVELIGIAAVLGVFTGLIVLMATREPVLALIFFGVAFIATLVVTALFVLGMKPTEAEQYDLDEQNGQAKQFPARPVLYDSEPGDPGHDRQGRDKPTRR